jgi:ferredoxin
MKSLPIGRLAEPPNSLHFNSLASIKRVMPRIKFIKEKQEIEVPEGANLRTAAAEAGIGTNYGVNGWGDAVFRTLNCHGLGACGTCRVLIKQGIENTNQLTLMEKLKFKVPVPTTSPDPIPYFAYLGNEDQMRLACQTKVLGDLEVETAPEMNLFGENYFS